MRFFVPMDVVPLDGGGHGYEPPSVESFDYPGLFGTEWIDKPLLLTVIAALVVITVWVLAARNLKLVPGKRQFAAEYMYDFIRNGVARDILGKDFRPYVPYLLGLFSFILVANWFGEFFLFMLPPFSKIGYAWALAFMTLFLYVGAGFKRHGIGFLRKAVLPAGVPWYLWGLIIPLEILSVFITRPVTLALRLFANLFAGHLVVMVFVIGGAFLLQYKNNWFYNVAGGVSLLFSVVILCLELFIGALQAYIFTVLTAQYVSSSLAEDH